MEFSRFEKSGFPYISRGFSSDQIDFRRCFHLEKQGDWAPVTELESFQRLTELIEGHERLLSRFLVKTVPDREDPARHFFDYEVWDMPATIFDRLMRMAGADFGREDFLPVYCELEAGFLRDSLPIAISVPVALTHFELDEFRLSDSAGVIEMPERLQVARQPSKYAFNAPAPELVVGAATHAFVLTDYTMENPSGDPYPPYEDPSWYPTDKIDRFFDALRTVTGLDTGYAQIFLLPLGGWTHKLYRDLPPVVRGPVVRRYPPHFDRSGWQEERTAVTEEQLCEVKEVFEALDASHTLGLAASRLSAAMLRESDDDKILDLLIGLEAAVGDDDDKGGIAYKLAMRVAATLSNADLGKPNAIYRSVKKLYGYRSAVAHGGRKQAAKHRTMEHEGREVAAPELAADFLRNVIRVLCRNADISGGRDVDSKLILTALAGESPAPEQP